MWCDYQGIDPMGATDVELVAFVHARTLVGVNPSTTQTLLWMYRWLVENDGRLQRGDGPRSVTVPATRLLSELWSETDTASLIAPPFQAPLLTLGEVIGLVRSAAAAPVEKNFDVDLVRARDAVVILIGYLAGIRPSEWPWIDLDHVVLRKSSLKLWLPEAKTGEFQLVEVATVEGLVDPAEAMSAYMRLRGEEPGPLLIDGRGHGPRRVDAKHLSYRMRVAAARTGIARFSAYSLRRSMAAHAQLLGVPPGVIRQRLRHTRNSDVTRRYVEPLLAVMDREEARARWLDPTVPDRPAVPVEAVRGRENLVGPGKLAFLAGTVADLTDDLDMAALRVPASIAELRTSSIESGRRTLRKFAAFTDGDPTDPSFVDLVLWVHDRLEHVAPQTVITEMVNLRIGLIDATGKEEWPVVDRAALVAQGAYNRALEAGEIDAPISRKKSPPATDEDLRLILPNRLRLGQEWAQAVLALATHGAGGEVTTVDDSQVVITLDTGRRIVCGPGEGILCPVRAGQTLGGRIEPVGTPTFTAVFTAAAGLLDVLRDRMVLTFAHASGARPSDLSRARVIGMTVEPNGLDLVLSVEKGLSFRKRTGRASRLWAPRRDDDLDPVAAWLEWRDWWPFPDGPLVPATSGYGTAVGDLHPLSDSAVGNIAGERCKAVGSPVRFYGFRYGRAGAMQDDGFSDWEIAEALNHASVETTRGYMQDYDAFADISFGRDPLAGPWEGTP